ncbi:rod shape-determining protein MreC [Novosphingobium piscinae]|uniref:Cell shape-determining protein MreC n=1 Tax=Novosphingobium piscinae TaxID=1507448 RepID=A0A7X1FYS9_9SPHN|nr:rod shape-determining protein MreC [Novosphingobium piscinae]MBC2669406.1 rod shape-determining protein MreC [Novosphingobium piscinae]
MAPPTSRRTGFSKRAQYGTFLGYVAAFAGMLAGAAVLVVAFINKDAFGGLRGMASDVAAPAGRTVAAGRAGAQDLGAILGGFLTSGATHARMRREIELARTRLAEAAALADENRHLRALLGLREVPERPVAFARMIASTASSTRRFATVSAGARQGVQVGMPVRTPTGLIGRVLEVGGSTARVLLVTDPESVVPVQRARDGVPALAQGHGDGTLQLRLVNLGLNPLKPGDVFVTSGSGGLYAPGTIVAVVVELTRDGAIARVLGDPATADYVAIYPVYAQAAGMPEALAPPPAVTPQLRPARKPAPKPEAAN